MVLPAAWTFAAAFAGTNVKALPESGVLITALAVLVAKEPLAEIGNPAPVGATVVCQSPLFSEDFTRSYRQDRLLHWPLVLI